MNKSKRLGYTLFLLIGVAILTALDQWTKRLAVLHLKGQESIVLIPGVLELEYLENRGAAFGMLYNQQMFFYIITVILVTCILVLFYRMPMLKKYLPGHITLMVITAGAIGNFIDRVVNQYVVDFIYFSLIDFPKFNMADIYITCGCIVVFILVLFVYKDEDFEFMSFRKKH